MLKQAEDKTYVDLDKIPEKINPRTQKWIDLLTGVPCGKALVLDLEKEGLTQHAVRSYGYTPSQQRHFAEQLRSYISNS